MREKNKNDISLAVSHLIDAMFSVAKNRIPVGKLEDRALDYLEKTNGTIPREFYKRIYNPVHWELCLGGNGIINAYHNQEEGTYWLTEGGNVEEWTKRVLGRYENLLIEKSKY